MNTTLNEIRKHGPCESGWQTLLKSLNKTHADDEPVSLMTILKSNGIQDAVWCLRCFDYDDYCLFLADVAESVLPIFERQHPGDDRPGKAIQAVRNYKAKGINKKQLIDAADAAADAADAVAADAADAAAAYAYAAYAAASAADAAAYAADAADAAAAYAADAADAADAAADAAARKKQWQVIEQLFIKHFGES